MVRYVLMDIEGTTTPVTFVHDVLFPYSRERMGAFVKARGEEPEVRKALEGVRATVKQEEGRDVDDLGAVRTLLAWIAADRKHGALKALQGMIWRAGYDEGAFTSQVYPDVAPALETWKKQGLTLGIYSSGSVEAQKLLFAHTEAGDLTPLLSDYFDTAVGGKREPGSYRRILEKLEAKGEDVLFLSDVPEELTAAESAGLRAVQIVRPGTPASQGHATAADFGEVARKLAAGGSALTRKASEAGKNA